MKYKFIIPCEIYDVNCFATGDIVSVGYVNVSADDVAEVWVEFQGKHYPIPVNVFMFCTEKIIEKEN